MPVRLVFLGRLEDVAGGPERDTGPGAYADVVARLDLGLVQAIAGPGIRVALNGALIGDPTALTLADGDELAFLPPVSGG